MDDLELLTSCLQSPSVSIASSHRCRVSFSTSILIDRWNDTLMVYTLKFIVCEYPGEWLSWVSHPGFDPECQYLIHQRMKLVHHPSPMMTQSTSCLETEGKGPVRCSGKKDKKTRQIGIFLFTRLGYTSSWGYSSVVQSLRNKKTRSWICSLVEWGLGRLKVHTLKIYMLTLIQHFLGWVSKMVNPPHSHPAIKPSCDHKLSEHVFLW